MRQKLLNCLAVSFSCPSNIAIGDIVELTGNKTVGKASSGSIKIVGIVDAHASGSTVCTVRTRCLDRRDDRVAGGAIPVGPIVMGSGGKVVAYSANDHSPLAVIGFAITAASQDGDVIETLEY